MISAIAGTITFAFTTLMTIAGLGAAFILIPVFIALGVDVHTAMAVALLLNAIAMSIASITFVRRKLVVWNIAIPVLIVASAVSPLGVWVSRGLDRELLLWLFVGFLLFASSMVLFYKPTAKATHTGTSTRIGVGIGVGSAAGFVGGLLGVGGGNIVVPALVALGFDPKKAAATTSFVVIFASLSGFLGHIAMAGIETSLLAWTAVGSAFGAMLGAKLMSDRMKPAQVKRVIGVVLILVAAKMVWDLI